MQDKRTVIINGRAVQFDHEVVDPSEIRTAAGLPADYEVWLIVKDPDPEGQLPIDDEQVTKPIELENGMRFRVVPPGTFGGR